MRTVGTVGAGVIRAPFTEPLENALKAVDKLGFRAVAEGDAEDMVGYGEPESWDSVCRGADGDVGGDEWNVEVVDGEKGEIGNLAGGRGGIWYKTLEDTDRAL